MRKIEFLVGVFVLLGIAGLLILALKASNLGQLNGDEGYRLTARFDNIGGLTERSSVTAGGVKVGKVESIVYDKESYQAVVTMVIYPQFNTFTEDTTASILTSGLLGEKYIGLEPGAEEVMLKDGDEIRMTQSAMILEQLIGQFLFSKAEGNE